MQFNFCTIFPVNCILLLLLCANVFPFNMEFYSSVHQMTKLVQFEAVFLRHMQKYIKANENKLEFLKARLEELEADRDEALREGADYFESPLNMYMLTKRLTMDWERVENLMQYESGKKSLNAIERYKDAIPYPGTSELDGAIDGLVRIQDVYRLNTADMAQGILDGVKYDVNLDARLCFDIAKYAAKENKTRLAHAWATEALRLRNVEVLPSEMLSVEEKIDKAEVLLMLAKTKTELGDLKGANQTLAELVQLRPNVENYTTTYLHFQAKYFESEYASVNLTEDHEPLPTNLFTTDPPTLYKHICNGLFTQSPSEERDLRCGYLTETHPFLLLAPIKAEELNHYPLLVLYYDVLSDAEIEIMRSLTKNRIVRSKIFGANESVVSRVRTSQAIFLPKTVHKILQTIDVRVEDMTNLNMNFAEDHQFQNYGIGGHYEQHYDWFDLSLTDLVVSDKEMGNRIATVLFYLTDVEQGGGTAFPYLKRLLKPKKGAAAFWYNLHASGEKDQRTLHGGCPIIVGSKWVLNRWIREHDQSERRPCELWSNV